MRTEMAGRQGRKSSKVDQVFERVPRYCEFHLFSTRELSLTNAIARSPVSYLILISAWLLFMLFITVGEVLIKRREIGRFLEQYVLSIPSVTFESV